MAHRIGDVVGAGSVRLAPWVDLGILAGAHAVVAAMAIILLNGPAHLVVAVAIAAVPVASGVLTLAAGRTGGDQRRRLRVAAYVSLSVLTPVAIATLFVCVPGFVLFALGGGGLLWVVSGVTLLLSVVVIVVCFTGVVIADRMLHDLNKSSTGLES